MGMLHDIYGAGIPGRDSSGNDDKGEEEINMLDFERMIHSIIDPDNNMALPSAIERRYRSCDMVEIEDEDGEFCDIEIDDLIESERRLMRRNRALESENKALKAAIAAMAGVINSYERIRIS